MARGQDAGQGADCEGTDGDATQQHSLLGHAQRLDAGAYERAGGEVHEHVAYRNDERLQPGAQRIGELADGKGQGCAQRPGEGSHAN